MWNDSIEKFCKLPITNFLHFATTQSNGLQSTWIGLFLDAGTEIKVQNPLFLYAWLQITEIIGAHVCDSARVAGACLMWTGS